MNNMDITLLYGYGSEIYHDIYIYIYISLLININMCLRGGLGWWSGSLGIDDFVNLEPI